MEIRLLCGMEAFQKYSYQERADKPYEFYSGYIALGLFRDENDVKFSERKGWSLTTLLHGIRHCKSVRTRKTL